MRILLVSSRFPEPGGRGDQERALLHVKYLAWRHELTVLTTQRASKPGADLALRELARVEVVTVSRARRAISALRALATGQPGQTGWMMPDSAWKVAQRLARDADVVLVNTSRSLRGPLAAPIVLDHVDALSYNMSERSRGPERLPVRLAAAFESRRMSEWEARLATMVAAQLGGSRDVARLLPRSPPVHVIPNSWTGEVFKEADSRQRDIDLIFTGNMDYPPNRLGADWLRREILPRVRSERPTTNCWIVGRAADRLAGPDLEIAADVPDMFAFLRRARVAVAPVYGAGTPWKTLEAAASGAAVVSTPWGLDCYDLPGAVAVDTDTFVASILGLLGDETARRRQVDEMQGALAANSPQRLGRLLDAIIKLAARSTTPSVAIPAQRGRAPRWLAGVPAAACAASLGVVLIDSPPIVSSPASAPHTSSARASSPPPLPAGCHAVPTPGPRPVQRLSPPTLKLDPSRRYVLKLTTNCGEIDIQLASRRSPKTSASVVYLANQGYYDGLIFNRIAPGFVVQGGEPPGRTQRGPGYTIVEPPPPSARYTTDTVWMFRNASQPAGASGSEFFIVVGRRIPLPPTFALLGTVVGGRDAVRAISLVPAVPPRDGTPTAPLVITSASVAVQ